MSEAKNEKNKETLKRVLIVIVLAVVFGLYSRLCEYDAQKELAKYDYSQVYALHGEVTEIEDYVIDNSTSYSVHVKLEDGKEVVIHIGGDPTNEYIGKEVTVYTDGYDYSFTQRGIAMENSKGQFINRFVPCLLILALWFLGVNYVGGWTGIFSAIGSTILVLIIAYT